MQKENHVLLFLCGMVRVGRDLYKLRGFLGGRGNEREAICAKVETEKNRRRKKALEEFNSSKRRMRMEKIFRDIAVAINSNFGEEHGFPADFIRAKVDNRGHLCFYFGSRDIEIDENGKVVGSGSGLSCWKIEHP